jgi:hypothetical protein
MKNNHCIPYILLIFGTYILISLVYSVGIHLVPLSNKVFLLLVGLYAGVFIFAWDKYVEPLALSNETRKYMYKSYLGSVAFALTMILLNILWHNDLNPFFLFCFLSALLAYTFGSDKLLTFASSGSQRRRNVLILCLYMIASFFIFHGGARNIFRSDYWLMATLFNTQSVTSLADLKRIVFFEMFGDIRFQPLGHLAMYIRHLAFGNSIMAYNILNMVLHAITAFLIYLIIVEITRTTSLASVLGAIYIVLPSQFDCVIWTYHIYILLSTICVLISVYLVLRCILTSRTHLFYLALIMDLVAILLYEPTLFSPAFLFIFLVGMTRWLDKKLTRRQILLVAGSILVFYACYFFLATVSLSYLKVNKSARMSIADLFQWKNLVQCFVGIWMNLWKTNFITNIGIPPAIKIEDILYVQPSKEMLKNPYQFLLLLCGIFFLSCFRVTKRDVWIALSFIGIAISYIFIISLGRVLTNNVEYIISQPRYQYFTNAVLFIAIGVMLVKGYEKKEVHALLKYFLGVIFILNSLNVMKGVQEVSAAMKPMNEHYSFMKGFFETEGKAKVFLDFVPDVQKKFFLGTDIALDILFRERISNHLKEATHVYDGKEIYKNILKAGKQDGRIADFTIQWMYKALSNSKPTKTINIIDGGNGSPKLFLSPDGYVIMNIRNIDSGMFEVIKFKHSYGENNVGNWSVMVVEKGGDEISFIFDGLLENKIYLKGRYQTWGGDGYKLLGNYYRGGGDAVFLAGLFIQLDKGKYGCSNYKIGSRIDVPAVIPW